MQARLCDQIDLIMSKGLGDRDNDGDQDSITPSRTICHQLP
jgi:hypothetical protein